MIITLSNCATATPSFCGGPATPPASFCPYLRKKPHRSPGAAKDRSLSFHS